VRSTEDYLQITQEAGVATSCSCLRIQQNDKLILLIITY
jgi:hypothetical protein